MNDRTRPRLDPSDDQPRLAVLIDADNTQPSVVEGLLAEVAKYGVASVKRIYGDFTSTRLTQWKSALLKHSISPVQQFAYTSGKNATDSSLIIDAMDLMYTRRFDGFCLVSSDSDFTRLAQRLREEGLMVYGFGEAKTPDAFVKACDKFIYNDVLRAQVAPSGNGGAAPARKAAKKSAKKAAAPGAPSAASSGAAASAGSTPSAASAGSAASPAAAATTATAARPATPRSLPLDLLRQAIEDASDDEGWAGLGAVGSYINKIQPQFDARLYGHKKLSDLLKQHPKHFLVEERGQPGGAQKALYVRLRD